MSYSFLVSQQLTLQLILHLAQKDCSTDADEANLGLGPELQVIKHEVGNEVHWCGKISLSQNVIVKREPINALERYSWTTASQR